MCLLVSPQIKLKCPGDEAICGICNFQKKLQNKGYSMPCPKISVDPKDTVNVKIGTAKLK